MMTEDIFGDGADYSDDFSLASGFDDINYDDPFNSNQHNNNVFSIAGNNNNEGLIFGKPMQGVSNIISNRTNLLELDVALFQNSAIDKGTIPTHIDVDQIQHNSSYPSSSLEPTTIRNIDPHTVFLAENGIASMNSTCTSRKKKDLRKMNQSSSSSLKSAKVVAVKARKTTTKMSIKPSKSDEFSSSIGYSSSATNIVNGIGNNGGGMSTSTKNRMSAIINVDDQIVANASTNDVMSETMDSLLHQACRLFPNSDTVVATALRVDADAVRRSMVINGDQEEGSSKKTNSTTYGYPINLALTHGANAKILKLLVQAGPDVLAFKDGENCAASMGTALSLNTCDMSVVDLLLSANQQCARIADRRGNYPLHVSVSYGRSIDIVKRLYAVYPEAQGMRNLYSQTPLDIAIQSTRCSDDVTDFLRSMARHTPYTAEKTVHTNKVDVDNPFGFIGDLDDIMQINCL